MDVFANLILAHMVADFPLQTSPVFRWKTRSIWGVAFHAFLHFLINALLFAPVLARAWPTFVVLFLLHIVQDQSKVKLGKENANTPFPFLMDQALHLFILAAAAFLPPLRGAGHPWLSTHWAFLLAGVTAATFAGTIFLYTLAQSIPGERHDLGITVSRQTVDFLFNGVLFGAILAGWYWLAALTLLCKGIFWKARVGGPYYSALLELGAGPLWVIAIGLLTQQARGF